jgi:sigma-B regulation protein RsbU (phosphoserine phosphatase)
LNPGHPDEGLSSQTGWRQVLSLGEELLCLAHEAFAKSWPIQEIITDQRDLIKNKTAHLLDAQVDLWLCEDELLNFVGKSQGGEKRQILSDQASAPAAALMRQCLQSRETCFGNEQDFEAQPAAAGQSQLQKITRIATPILVQDRQGQTTRLLGVLSVERPQGPTFSEEQIALLDGLAIQTTLALQSSLQTANERWRLEQLSLVRQVNAQIANLRDLDELARRVTGLILETFHYYYVAIFTLEPGQEGLHFRASAGPTAGPTAGPGSAASAEPPESDLSPMFSIHVGEGIIGHVAQSGEEILANDVSQEARYHHLEALAETLSEVALPLKVEERILGILDVQSDQIDYFNETDMLVLRALANNIALAVEGIRLYSALHQRASQLSAIYEVGGAITSILDQDRLLDEVVNLIHKRFGYPFVHIFTVHQGRRKVFYEAGSGLHSKILHKEEYAYDLDDPLGMIPWVARSGESILANDVDREPRYRPSRLPPDETRSELTVPLAFGGEVLGVLDVQSDRLNAFGEEDRFLFETLAGNIAIALRNAYLYRSESWRRRVAESMNEVAGLLSADIALDEVLRAILSELERSLPLDLAAIWLLDEDTPEGEIEASPALRLAAMHGIDTAQLDLEIGLSPEEILEFNPSGVQELPLEEASSWFMEALASDQPVIREQESPFDPLAAALDYPVDYSAIAAPLRVGEQSLGLLTLAHRTSRRYGGEAYNMTAAFASYAAVAIENTRLYEAAHEQAWISTVLLQVAEATQSLTDLNELLTTVIHITPDLVGVRVCLVYTLDEDGNFLPAAASGLSPQAQASFENERFAPGDVPVLDELLDQMRPILLRGDEEEQPLADLLGIGEPQSGPPEFELSVMVPLAARGESLGALLVAYSVDPLGSRGKTLEELFDERLAIVQGIAQQTAIAMDNLRLIKSQKEEAYVSVALLQVAQAVVSSNDLDVTLGSIVRITPILVGVKRTAIYLWNESQRTFQLSQAYGLPRTISEGPFSASEFPLLEAAMLEEAPLACALDGGQANSEQAPEAWPLLEAPDSNEMQEYIKNEPCLLLAFPLWVKGKALGVMLVEEPTPEGKSSSGSANRRLREKRMEIITGISQQAALAIQNDQLQQEMVERERMERELQLARDIQRTFLPQQLPDLPGWEMKMLWRPAREVGGDFYDFFELPGKRLGLVIADVADKGMPAALFMTLVRTLLRATIQQTASPAEALGRVNDALVPDAPAGMFVTLAYAVLSLESGELQIANAGHNPPLVLRRRGCRLERLVRSGMALGVQAGNHIRNVEIALEAGDFLVMYTDGVTEAFSEEGDLYGEERLQETIETTALCVTGVGGAQGLSAQEMLESIDRSVAAFMGDSMPSDDLTLLVLKRFVS